MSKSHGWLLSTLTQARPANVILVKEWIGPPTLRDGLPVRAAELFDGSYVWATWGGSSEGHPEYYWGPLNPRDCGDSGNWQPVPAEGEYCARAGHLLTIGVRDTGELPVSDYITGGGREGWLTVWAHSAHRIVGSASHADVQRMRGRKIY